MNLGQVADKIRIGYRVVLTGDAGRRTPLASQKVEVE
jgi:hypothetical protein